MRKPALNIDESTKLLHKQACDRGDDTYVDPDSGYRVITEEAHQRRGTCCGSKCRHCPFDWVNVRDALLGLLAVIAAAFTSPPAEAQLLRMPLDTVMRYSFGGGQRTGQGASFFPANVLRGPSPSARDTVPATDPREICSIGLGGEITLGLRRAVITDGPGPDLAIYENPFFFGRGRTYVEPASVEVSRDGTEWIMFPFDSLSCRGLAGVTPTSGNDPYDPSRSGGDWFDLAELGVDSIRWVRLRDVTEFILSNPSSPFFDPTLTGFDLDVVVTRYAVPIAWELELRPVVNTMAVELSLPRATTVQIMDVTGRVVDSQLRQPGIMLLDLSWLPAGWYYVIVDDGERHQLLRYLRS